MAGECLQPLQNLGLQPSELHVKKVFDSRLHVISNSFSCVNTEL